MSASAPAADPRGVPEVAKLSLQRRAMARHCVAGAAAPVFYLRMSADVTELVDARAGLRAAAAEGELVPTLNDAIVRAVALSLREHPGVNASWEEEGAVAVYPHVNVGVAMAIPGNLVVPSVLDADEKDVHEIAAAVREVADLAQRRKLTREQLAAATFTVSNLGMFGIEDFDPIVNVPQAAILGVGAARVEPATQRRLMRIVLGCDHRVLTGAEGAQFLASVRERLETGAVLLDRASTATAVTEVTA